MASESRRCNWCLKPLWLEPPNAKHHKQCGNDAAVFKRNLKRSKEKANEAKSEV